jgi:hypothetical protein
VKFVIAFESNRQETSGRARRIAGVSINYAFADVGLRQTDRRAPPLTEFPAPRQGIVEDNSFRKLGAIFRRSHFNIACFLNFSRIASSLRRAARRSSQATHDTAGRRSGA